MVAGDGLFPDVLVEGVEHLQKEVDKRGKEAFTDRVMETVPTF